MFSTGARPVKRAATTAAGPRPKMPKLLPLASCSVSADAVKLASVPLVAR